jgi:rhodanese-related sulfurtransferase
MKHSITPAELAKRLKEGERPLILDIRRAEDVQADPSYVPGAERRDPAKAETWAKELALNQEVVIYCKHGRSISNSVLDTLQAHGVNACFIEGGFSAWKGE